MDLGTIGPILIGALAALGAIGQYLRRQARADRAENRKLRRMVLAYDGHTFALERDYTRATGRAARSRPSILMEAEHDDDEDAVVPEAAGAADEFAGAAGGDAGAGPEA